MAKSFNSILPALGDILCEPPDTLRTRQRALVAAGLLESKSGKGPGSGVPATPKALAQFLIGTCTGSEGPYAKGIARASDGSTTFLDTLSKILSDNTLAERVDIRIVTRGGLVDITYADGSRSHFYGKGGRLDGVMFQAVINSKTLRKLADLLGKDDQ